MADIVLAMKPRWMELILEGRKTVECRRVMPVRLEVGDTVYLYCRGQLHGEVQIDFWDQQEWPRLLRLQRGQRVLALGRMSGKINTNGFWNAAVYGDALYLDHADDGFKEKD